MGLIAVLAYFVGMYVGVKSMSPERQTVRTQKQLLTQKAPDDILEIAKKLNEAGFVVVPLWQWQERKDRP